MQEAIGIRLEKDMIEKIEDLGEETEQDRSTIIRQLIKLGYQDMLREMASKAYIEGRITLSEAAKRAGLTIWDMQHFLIDKGFKSQYSVEDLQAEMKLLGKRR